MKILCALTVIAYIWSLPTALSHYTGKSKKVLNSHRVLFIDELSTVGEAINKSAEKGAYAISPWPGYLFESDLLPYPHTENHFGFRIAEKLSHDQRELFKVMATYQIQNLISEAKTSLVVINKKSMKKEYASAISKGNYQEVFNSQRAIIFKR